jgi:hypothetical protein
VGTSLSERDAQRILPVDAIRAIDDPTFVSAGSASFMRDSDPVMAVAIGSEAHAYPIAIMSEHEIVNDTISGRPIAATW